LGKAGRKFIGAGCPRTIFVEWVEVRGGLKGGVGEEWGGFRGLRGQQRRYGTESVKSYVNATATADTWFSGV